MDYPSFSFRRFSIQTCEIFVSRTNSRFLLVLAYIALIVCLFHRYSKFLKIPLFAESSTFTSLSIQFSSKNNNRESCIIAKMKSLYVPVTDILDLKSGRHTVSICCYVMHADRDGLSLNESFSASLAGSSALVRITVRNKSSVRC